MDVRPTQTRRFRPTTLASGLHAQLHGLPKAADEELVADMLSECALPGDTLVVGVTGSVAAGKSTFCARIAGHLRRTLQVEIVSTDGFLRSNAALEAQGLLLRKGFPESYDVSLLSGALQRVRWGPVRIPGYSHATYDLAPDLDRTINRPDIVLVEGLGLSPRSGGRDPTSHLDLLIYIDAAEQDLEAWYVRRFLTLWREAEADPTSFYARFRGLTEEDAEAFAQKVWTAINLPNLRDHILPARDLADLIIAKSADHRMRLNVHPRRRALS